MGAFALYNFIGRQKYLKCITSNERAMHATCSNVSARQKDLSTHAKSLQKGVFHYTCNPKLYYVTKLFVSYEYLLAFEQYPSNHRSSFINFPENF